MREYSPYIISQLRGCLQAGVILREAQFELWKEMGTISRYFHRGAMRPPRTLHPDEQKGGKTRRSLLFQTVLQITNARVGWGGVGARWTGYSEFEEIAKAYIYPKLVECKQPHRWDTAVPWVVGDPGHSCATVLRHTYDQGWAKLLFQFKQLEAVRRQALWDLQSEIMKIGVSRTAVKCVSNYTVTTWSPDLMKPIPDTDQGMIDLYWEAMLAEGIESRMTLHKAVLTFMTENYLKSSKVSLGNWIEHRVLHKSY